MNKTNRRDFLGVVGTGMVAGLTATRFSIAQTPGHRIQHAIIGTGGQGRGHAQAFSSFEDCDVVAICDVDPQRRENIGNRLPNSDQVMLDEDYRRILDNPDIDSVSIATPDHWHTPIALAALEAGKHVYVEKPCSHTIHEAKLLAQAAAASGKCVQHGTQGRSSVSIKEGIAFMRSGIIGEVRMAKAINHQHRRPIGRTPVSDPPPGVNYDLWTGPAPAHPFTQNRWHYNWHWFWDYGAGDISNDGIHQIDQARWGLGVEIPKAVVASGGQLYYDDDNETPDTQTVIFEYDKCHLLYEMRLWTEYPLEGHDNGVIFYGDGGRLEIGRRGCEATLLDGEKVNFGPYVSIADHMRNFLDCIKNNTPSALAAQMDDAAVSTALCYLGNIATRVERRLTLDPDTWNCIDDPEALAMYTKEYRQGYELPGQYQ